MKANLAVISLIEARVPVYNGGHDLHLKRTEIFNKTSLASIQGQDTWNTTAKCFLSVTNTFMLEIAIL